MEPTTSIKEEEKALISACVNREPGRWEDFVQRYDRLVWKIAATLHGQGGKSAPAVEDLVAHVYEKLLEDQCRRLKAWRGQARFSTYLVRVTRNLCIDQLKRTNKEVPIDELGDVSDPHSEENEPGLNEWKELQLNALREAITKLTPKRAMIMQLRLKGIPLREIAATMGVPEGTVFVENSRAMITLRRIIEPVIRGGLGTDAEGGDAEKRDKG